MKPLFVSGWAGCECLYPNLALSCRMLVPFIRHDVEEIAAILRQGGTTLLGWSTGAHLILRHLPDVLEGFERIVLAAPFLSFTRYVPAHRLDAMISGMSKDPGRTVDHFMARCGHCGPLSVVQADHEALLRGLRFLLTSEAVLPQGLHGERVTLVHGDRDRIVPVQASRDLHALLPGSTFLQAPGGHKIEESLLQDLVR